MNGKEFLKTIKTDNEINNIPIIVITASTRLESEALKSQVQGFLIKPIKCFDLFKEIQNKLPFLFYLSPENDYLSQLIQGNMSNNDKIINIELTSESLLELQERLQKQKRIWQEALKTLSTRKLNEFANNLKKLTKEYPYLPLIEYTQELNQGISRFDKNKVEISLNYFPELLASINSKITS